MNVGTADTYLLLVMLPAARSVEATGYVGGRLVPLLLLAFVGLVLVIVFTVAAMMFFWEGGRAG